MNRITVAVCSMLFLGSLQWLSARVAPVAVAPGVLRTGVIIEPEVTESSGLVASRRFSGVFWTHNDHGQSPKLFAISREGGTIGKFKVTGATISDWEDISIDGAGNLYIADIGNNEFNRDEVQIYRIVEPNPRGAGSVRVTRSWHLKYPNQPKDCEAFIVHGNFGYLISKQRKDNLVEMFRFPLSATTRVTLQSLGKIRVAGDVTGGAISRDAQSLALITEKGAYVYRINGNPLAVLRIRGYFTPFDNPQMEGASFAGNGLLVTGEDGQLFLFNSAPFRTQ